MGSGYTPPGGGGGTLTEITSPKGTLNVTDPTGPTAKLDTSGTLGGNNYTTSWTFGTTDLGGEADYSSSSAGVGTIPAGLTTIIGTTLSGRQLGTGGLTVTGAAGVTVNGVSAGSYVVSGQYQTFLARQTATDVWVITASLPLPLPATTANPLKTQGGNMLDDGSGNISLDSSAILRLGGVGQNSSSVLLTPTAPNTVAVGNGAGGSGNVSAGNIAANHLNAVPTTPALPANPPVSGTVYQNTTGGPILLKIPVTATAIGGSAQLALGSTNAPAAWGGAEQIGVSGELHNVDLLVPNGWYWSITAVSATIGTASVLGQ
ncbi:MAG: hypothetical protein ACYCV4_02440 [Dermatophilaceae bacterium]